MASLDELKTKWWFPWAVGAAAVAVVLWLFWSTPGPVPVKTRGRGQGEKERLYDLKIGSWQNRVDQDLEATKKQIAEIDMNQLEVKEQLRSIEEGLA
ncbi:MAG: hypothetical protein ACE5JO_12830, partial [Candidatus Binatia bacterium]